MFKLVVLCALLAVGAASIAPLAYTASYAVPSAVSYQARTDVVSKPIVATTYSAAAPVVAAHAAVPVAAPAAISYSAPLVAAPVALSYAAPALIKSVAAPAVISSYSAPALLKSTALW